MADLIELTEVDGRVMLELGRADPARPIPQYPGWTATDLIVHTAMIHGRTTLICETLPTDRISSPRRPEEADPFDWFEQNLVAMTTALRQGDLSSRVWSFTQDESLRFWVSRMAIETAVHRWDMEQSAGEVNPLSGAVAAAGLDEFGTMWYPRLGQVPPIMLEATDLGRVWSFGTGTPQVSVSGSASDLYLRLMSRGDLNLPPQWTAALDELAPPPRP